MSWIGSTITAVANARGRMEQNRWNVRAAKKSHMRNLYMSGTAYQRSMADMRRAGLNPMLAYQQGGASTAASGAMAAKRLFAEVKQMKANTRNIEQNTKVGKEEEKIRRATAQIERSRVPGATTEGKIDKSTYGKVLRYINRLVPAANSAAGVARGARRGPKGRR